MTSPRKAAVVTGGAHGIGRAIAERLLDDGMAVLLVDWNLAAGRAAEADLARRGEVVFLHADVGREADCRRVAQAAQERWGRLDLLVNNAGLSEFKPLADETLEHWNRVLAVNLTGPFLLSRLAAPLLRDNGGAIVNIASTRARQSEPGTEAYSASKGGLVALTHALAMSLGPEVRVNCVSPGWIDVSGDSLRPEDHAQHPAGRVGRPEDVAALVAWLAGPDAGFVTGSDFIVDGGMTRKMIYAG
ncbi:MAG: SDR family oxidoreductase [Pseudomonadota bacterium]